MGDFRSILNIGCLNACIAHKLICMLTIKQLLELVQPDDWSTNVDLKAHFQIRVAQKNKRLMSD